MTKKILYITIITILSAAVLCGCVSIRHKSDKPETEPETETKIESGDDTSDETDPIADTSAPETTSAPDTTGAAESTAAPDTAPVISPVQDPAPVGVMYPTILTYHLVLDEPYTQFTNLFVRVSDFEDQLKNLSSGGYNFLFADQFGKVDQKSVILTFDDGYEDNYTNMFPLIKKYNARATVFLIAYKIGKPGYLNSDQIKEMADSGLVRFGSHTSSHFDLRNLGESELRDELGGSKSIISSLTGQDINCICYPAGGYNSTTLALAKEYYSYGFTTNSGKYAGEDILELPRIAVQRGMTGSGLLWTVGG